MALIEHIRRCNSGTLAGLYPFQQGDLLLGLVRPEVAAILAEHPDLFTRRGEAIQIAERWPTASDRTQAFRPIAERLVAEGLCGKLRREDFRVVPCWGAEPVMQVDRGVVVALGARGFGLHVNGKVMRSDGIHLWIGKRAADKPVEPGKFDNMVAGGQPADLGLMDNLVKEAAEEAGLSESQARRAQPVGAITYCMADRYGLRRDCLFLFDLALDDSVIPEAVDGEMEGFSLMPSAAILDRLRQGFDFKFNVALVLIDFFIRHGLLDADNEPDYLALLAGLHPCLD